MLRYKEDWRTLAYMAVTTALLVVQWSLPELNPVLFVWSLFMAVTVAVIAHNHNHLRIWRSRTLNALTDYWITLFYGFPAYAWIPTHNMNHHKHTNRPGDHTATWRLSERNNILTLLSYPAMSAWWQQVPVKEYLQRNRRHNRKRFAHSIFQYVLLATWVGGAMWLDWEKALLYIVAPGSFSLFTILVFNYLQHVHADEESELDHSRNIVGPLMNWLLFNNGYHTAHHLQPGLHWSRLPQAHARIADRIDPSLNERSFWWLVIRTYLLSFIPRFRSRSMRLARIERAQRVQGTEAQHASAA